MSDIKDLLKTMDALREKCPWDAKQTHQSLMRYLLEEAYEVLDSIEQENWDELKKELGDILLQVVFHSRIASENGHFRFEDVVEEINNKMIERHPHVFGDVTVNSADDVQKNWEKSKYKSENRESMLSGIPNTLPALLKAQKLQEKAASIGFDWEKVDDILEKLNEEIAEFRVALKENKHSQMQAELGDIFFSVVNISRFLKINAEESLTRTNRKFMKRFEFIEKHFDGNIDALHNASLEELDNLWDQAKGFESE